ncbi:hypothetical protein L873DRAFT_1470150 [Choiromyces venosus 120613-1]|uniref:Uncharacterized protein n=1 Tax=Choiromyces venosus 120613-1 TaxID=1336337 RepID=A0A3N4J7E9_9PEZI|nr:hypothetical protein L873DRAFT_1470150 [Choiromyces venosus 120613-1]
MQRRFSQPTATQNLPPLLNELPVEIPNDTLELYTYGYFTAHESRQDHIEATAIADDGEEEGKQKYANDNLSSLDFVASSYVQHLSAQMAGLAAKCSAHGRAPQASHRHRQRQRSSQQYQNQTNISADSADLASRITDWIPPPPEFPLPPTLFDPDIAAAYPLPPSRVYSETTPSTYSPPPKVFLVLQPGSPIVTICRQLNPIYGLEPQTFPFYLRRPDS